MKMELGDERQNQLIAALNAGRMPELKSSHRHMLPLTRRNFVTLIDRDGQPTEAGWFVYDRMGQDLPTDTQVDQGQRPYMKGPNKCTKPSG